MAELLEIELSKAERRRMKEMTKDVLTRLVSQTPEFIGVINSGENRLLRLLSPLPAIIMAGLTVVLLLSFQDTLSTLPYPTFLTEFVESIGVSPIVLLPILVFFGFFFVNPLGRFLDTNLLQIWSGMYLWLNKWPQGEEAKKILEAVERLIQTRPEQIKSALLHGSNEDRTDNGLPEKVCQAVEDFPGAGAPPAIVMRKFMERKLKSAYVGQGLESLRSDERGQRYERQYFLRARMIRNGIRTQLLFDKIGAILRAEIPGDSDWQREYYTDTEAQETALFDSHDLHQRYRTAAPHYRWPNETATGVGETALYRLISCIENPMLQPFYLITVAEIIAKFPDVVTKFLMLEDQSAAEDDPRIEQRVADYIERLTTVDVQVFGKWEHSTLRLNANVSTVPMPIMKNMSSDPDNPDYCLRWDPNRTNLLGLDDNDGETRKAFAVLAEAIELAGKESTPVRLSRGDAILMDNLRCLIARREISSGKLGAVKRFALYPQSWWLRGYYGFRIPEHLANQPNLGASFAKEVQEKQDFAAEKPLDETMAPPMIRRDV